MAVYTQENEGLVEAIVTNAYICEAVDLAAGIVPKYVPTTNALWDTGATNTLVSRHIVEQLGLQPFNRAIISGIGGDVETDTYLVHVILPTKTVARNVEVMVNDNPDYDVVIGMDIISLVDFAFTNAETKSVFSFRHPAQSHILFADKS